MSALRPIRMNEWWPRQRHGRQFRNCTYDGRDTQRWLRICLNFGYDLAQGKRYKKRRAQDLKAADGFNL